jgi:hypothetical protein
MLLALALLACTKPAVNDTSWSSTPVLDTAETAQETEPPPPVYGCEVVIPADAAVVSEPVTVTEEGTSQWVCPSGELTSSADDTHAYLESDAKIVVTWPGAVVWAKDYTSVTVLTSGVTVVQTVRTTVINEAPGTTFVFCDEVVFDTGDAPAPGCG